MPGRSVEKFVVMATGKVEGKVKIWVAAVFPGVAQAKPWVALLNLAHKAADLETVKAMDVHAPIGADGKLPEGVKYTGSVIQYSPDVAALSDDTTLG
jgi:hypothetical protein